MKKKYEISGSSAFFMESMPLRKNFIQIQELFDSHLFPFHKLQKKSFQF